MHVIRTCRADLIDLGAELRKIGGENGGRYFYHFKFSF